MAAKEQLAGPGAGASAASAPLAETAATRTAQAIFLISMAGSRPLGLDSTGVWKPPAALKSSGMEEEERNGSCSGLRNVEGGWSVL